MLDLLSWIWGWNWLWGTILVLVYLPFIALMAAVIIKYIGKWIFFLFILIPMILWTYAIILFKNWGKLDLDEVAEMVKQEFEKDNE